MSKKLFDRAQRTIYRNSLAGFVGTNLKLLIELAGFAILIRILEIEAYGAILLAGAFINQLETFDGGILKSLEKFIPHYLAREDDTSVAYVITLGILLIIVVGVLVGLALVLLKQTEWLLLLPHEDENVLNSAALMAAFLIPIAWPCQSLKNVVFGFTNQHHVYIIEVAESIISLVLSVVAAFLGAGVAVLILLRTLPRVFAVVPLIWSIRRVYRGPLWKVGKGSRIVIKEIWRYSAWLLVMKLATVFNYIAVRILPAIILGVAAVPLFFGLRHIIDAAISLNNGFKQAALPVASGLTSLNKREDLNDIAVAVTRVMTAMFAPLLVALAIFSPLIVDILGGVHMTGLGEGLALALILLVPINSRAFIFHIMLGVGEKMAQQTVFNVFSSLLFMIITGMFLYYGGVELGITAHSVTHALTMPWLLFLFSQHFGINIYLLTKNVILALLPSLIIGAVAIPVVWSVYRDMDIFSLLGLIGATTLVLLGASFRFGLNTEFRGKIIRNLRTRFLGA